MPDISEGRWSLYVGWMMSEFAHAGFIVRIVSGHRLHLMPPDDRGVCFEIEVPYPPEEWPT
jgi:hypothetical protein